MIDCLIIGGGPAGLTAAIYLARYHISVMVADDGRSRANLIPMSRNLPGFSDGISGPDYLSLIRTHAFQYPVDQLNERVISLGRDRNSFVALTANREIRSRAVLLSTGVVNRRPDMSASLHDAALSKGLLRYCPICDGFEVTDMAVAVLGNSPHAVSEVEFIRSYTENVTLISHEIDENDENLRERLKALGAKLLVGLVKFEIDADSFLVHHHSGNFRYRAIYPALGSEVRSELGIRIGAAVSPEGCLKVDSGQATNIEGLYAAGDVIKGLDQIASALGHGSVAATAIRSYIATKRSMLR